MLHNFYIQGKTTGRIEPFDISSGKQTSSEIQLDVFMRDEGRSVQVLTLRGSAFKSTNSEIVLQFEVIDESLNILKTIRCER